MKKTIQMFVGILLLTGISSVVRADKDHPGHHGHHGACKADVHKFCPGKHGPEKKACMEQNKAQFSPACQEAMAKHEQHDHHEEAPHSDHQ